MPQISVIIPTYNRGARLGGAIESVRAQTFQDWELLVVDDGSTDETPALVQAHVQRDARICSVRQSNAGAAAARNQGIRSARGAYLAFLDDDDRWAPQKLDTQLRFLMAHAEVGWVYSFMRLVNEATGAEQLHGRALRSFKELFRGYFIGPQTVLLRRACVERVGRFDESRDFFGAEDTDFFLRLGKSFAFHCIPEPLVIRTLHEENDTLPREARCLEAFIRIYRALDLRGQSEVSRLDRIKRVASLHHYTAGFYRRHRAYRQAAVHFLRAALTYPPVGLYVAPGSPHGLRAVREGLSPLWGIAACTAKSFNGNVTLSAEA